MGFYSYPGSWITTWDLPEFKHGMQDFLRLQVVPHFSSGTVERAKCKRAWKSPLLSLRKNGGTTCSLGFSCLFVGKSGNHTYKLQTWINQVRVKWCLPSSEVINFPFAVFWLYFIVLGNEMSEIWESNEKNSGVRDCLENGAGMWHQGPLFQTLFLVKTCMAYWSAIIIIAPTGRLQFFFVSLFVLL